jgi:adenylate kinase family enzyme
MGFPVLILGESGSGKSYSIKEMDPEKVGIFSVEKTRLPFRKKFNVANKATYPMIRKTLSAPKLKTYVIDDSQYLMANDMFDRSKEPGYGKFTDMAKSFRDLIHFINIDVPDDVIVYFLHHTELDSNTGRTKAKTCGKMLDNQLTVEGCFNIVLLAQIEDKNHYFVTQSDGFTTAKSPEGMFEEKIPNDLAAVDLAIRNYYEI